jgi:hypothetical protein
MFISGASCLLWDENSLMQPDDRRITVPPWRSGLDPGLPSSWARHERAGPATERRSDGSVHTQLRGYQRNTGFVKETAARVSRLMNQPGETP